MGDNVEGVAPEIKPFLDLYPLPNGRDLGDGRAEFLSGPTQRIREDFFLVRLDHQISDTDSIFGSDTFTDSGKSTPEDSAGPCTTARSKQREIFHHRKR